MSLDINQRKTSERELIAVIIWIALIVGTILNLRVPIFGRMPGNEINLSLFDLILVLALGFVSASKTTVVGRNLSTVLKGLSITGLLIVLHAAYTYYVHPPWDAPEALAGLDGPGLLREATKLLTILAEIAATMVVFTASDLRRLPPAWPIALAVGGIALFLLGHWTRTLLGVPGNLVNIEAHSLAGALAILICCLWPLGHKSRVAAIIATSIVSIVMFVTLRKAYFLVCVAYLAIMLTNLWTTASLSGRPKLALRFVLGGILGVAMLGVIQLIVVIGLYPADTPLAIFPQSFESSATSRIQIQSAAVSFAKEAMPWGIGIGQFQSLVYRTPGLQQFLPLTSPHNTPLSFVLSMGVLGIGVCAGLFYLIYLACRTGEWTLRLIRFTFLVPPMLSGDTQGLRMTILFLGYFASLSLLNSQSTTAGTREV